MIIELEHNESKIECPLIETNSLIGCEKECPIMEIASDLGVSIEADWPNECVVNFLNKKT